MIHLPINDWSLRLQLLRHLPAFLEVSLGIRRRLSLAWFFDDSSYLGGLPDGRLDCHKVASFLRDSRFTINNATDYGSLAASMAILDIAIDAADRPFPMTKQEEAAFNRDIDLIAATIKAMFTQIVDSGLSNIKRTETKEVLEGMYARLVYAVRTKRPPKTSIFGESTLGEERDAMRDWVDAKTQKPFTNGNII